MLVVVISTVSVGARVGARSLKSVLVLLLQFLGPFGPPKILKIKILVFN